ncbi:tyrosine-type recombinase/integrase [Sphingomonas sp. PB4P5]|uniref:tyrosine-type recombinase/integrase n=1 Tax=Parasphingomonas puruogangriensis TaxID=3096155 RepID=UPI002FC8C6C1
MATRSLNKLTARQVSTLKQPGRHADGGGLYLRITATNSRSWVFMTSAQGKRVEIGLGKASAVGLATARGLAAAMREAVAIRQDPRSVLAPAQAEQCVPTFGEYSETYISRVESGWRSEVHRQQWRQSLRDHARAIRDKSIDHIDTDDVISVLTPIWSTKPETAKRVRGRIEKVLDAAKAHGLRPRDAMNPAVWRGHLALLMPAPSKLSRGHHAALPWKVASTFMAQLRGREALAARCLEFVILTAARSGEALGATWGEIDLKTRLWTLPAHRMKAGSEHIVPLSDAAVNLLEDLRPGTVKPAERVFSVAGAARSNMAMTMLLRRMKADNVTVHGFRSTFRDWAGDATNYPRELIEQALAHTIGNKAERSYRRGTAIERRRELMQDWSRYLQSQQEPGEQTGS